MIDILMKLKVDLHTHTIHSDGSYTTEELLIKAKQSGIQALSITDHDNISAIEEATELGKKIGMEIIPGVEISTDYQDKEVHILAYFFNIKNDELNDCLKFFRDERLKRAVRIVKKLQNLGLHLTIEDVLEETNSEAVGRPHIASAMLKKGLISSYYEAFNKYIGNDCPAYEKKVHLSPKSAFKIINDAGGLAFLAHPGNMPEDLLKDIISSGVDGIEVVHPSHNKQLVNYYKGIANQYYLLQSGGSDFHGGKRNDENNLGDFYIDYSALDAMRQRLLRDSA